ncbi:shikimate dehydrogenase [Aliifodinibius sp. S!AR15-10]|uniref:shikimate dehydrogenase n=1 Tax=Aliifodinibius sp. S!AR15-10 TaxID=2950437 RepID=UPI002865F709|nr:shikimate dehydrogenase [Aliifodinibius sp. S!AR15-10]MDR8392348.1 shikimate dehydrogenase [Aliifodinibius sp. S!AR15-10]
MRFTEFKKSEYIAHPHLLLLGHPVSHSVSPIMHNTAAEHYGLDLQYFAIDLQPNEFNDIASHFNRETFNGTNITVPYKEMLMDYVDEIEPLAKEIGAINTIFKRDNKLVATNTDIYGFLKPLEPMDDELFGMRAIIFGTGGASKAIVAGLVEIGLEELFLVSRSPARNSGFEKYDNVKVIGYDQWTAYSDETSLFVNTTPLGMEPNIDASPVRDNEKEFLSGKICYDIVYKPKETKFLRLASEVEATTLGGLDMLVYQGSESFKKWTGKPFPIEKVKAKLNEYIHE